MPVGDVLPEIAVLIAAAGVLLTAMFVPQSRQWLGAVLALIGLLAAAVLCIAQLGDPQRLSFSGSWAVDAVAVWARLFIVVAAALAVMLTPEWLREDRRHGEYYAVLLLSTLGVMLLAGAADTLQMVVALLLSSVTGYTLAAYHRNWPLSVEAGMKYFLVGAFTNTLLMIGVTLLFGVFGTTDYSEIANRAAAGSPQTASLVALLLVVLGIGFKLAAVPAHTWMPDVAEGAPPPAAAFLTVAPKIGAAVALVRLLQLFPPETMAWQALAATLAAATMTVGNLGALWQTDVRRLLGWSSVSQSGYALMAVTVVGLSDRAIPALLYFLAAYGLANVAAFAVVTQLRGRTKLSHYRGLAAARPLQTTVLVLSFLSLVGIPPLAGFVGKLTLFVAAIDAGYAWLAVVAIINTVVSLVYYLRVLGPMYFGEPPAPVHVLGPGAHTVVLVAGISIVVLGVAAQPLLSALPDSAPLP